jgi:NAD(P)-dependent dehydrogenase (short-subunit alcohol dehydrogenase family)
MTQAFPNRRIFVTGAAAGIGLACVERFLAGGARIGCLDRDGESLSASCGKLDADRVVLCEGDVAAPEDVGRAIACCAKCFGGLDGLVNCAGIDLASRIEETTDEAWRQVFAINLDGPMHVCRAGMPHLRAAGGGTIVNVSSGAGLQPLKHRSAYCASKAGLQMFSKALAMEAAEFGIRVNAVCPGAVNTGLLRSIIDEAPDPAMAEEAVRSRYALGRIARPEEIAAAILWLTSEESSFVTGAAIAVDGGRTFH